MIKNSRSQNSLRNILANSFNRGIILLFPFIIRTMIVYILGKSYLGLSSLFSSILQVLNISELGFGSALVFSMYKPVAENNTSMINALLNEYKKIYHIIGIVILFSGLVLMPFLPKLINGSWPNKINIYLLYIIYLINSSISYFGFSYKRALLIAYQRKDIISNINTTVTILMSSLQIILLLTTKNYYSYIICLPLFTLAENIWINIVTNHKFPNLKCEGSISIFDRREITKHVKGIALQKFCSVSRNAFDNIVISMYLGLNFSALYSNYYYIMSAIHMILYMIPDSIRASVGNSIVSEDLDKNYQNFKIILFVYNWIASFCTVSLFCLFQPFIKIWMGATNLLPFITMILFCVYFYELSIGDIVALYKDAAGLWWYGRYRTIIEAFLNLILNFLLGKFFGINGILFATVITILFMGIGYGGFIVYKYYFKSKTIKDLLILNLKYISITIIAIIITYFTTSMIMVTNEYISLLLKGVICLIIPNLIWLICFKSNNEFLYAKYIFNNLIKNKCKNKEKRNNGTWL